LLASKANEKVKGNATASGTSPLDSSNESSARDEKKYSRRDTAEEEEAPPFDTTPTCQTGCRRLAAAGNSTTIHSNSLFHHEQHTQSVSPNSDHADKSTARWSRHVRESGKVEHGAGAVPTLDVEKPVRVSRDFAIEKYTV
jgi:hypothetical protein